MDNMVTVLVSDSMLRYNITGIITLAIVVVCFVAAASFLAYKAVKKQREEEESNAE